MQISNVQLDRIGELADKADNFLPYADSKSAFALAITRESRFDALQFGLTELRDQLRALVVEIGIVNPWAESSPETKDEPSV